MIVSNEGTMENPVIVFLPEYSSEVPTLERMAEPGAFEMVRTDPSPDMAHIILPFYTFRAVAPAPADAPS